MKWGIKCATWLLGVSISFYGGTVSTAEPPAGAQPVPRLSAQERFDAGAKALSEGEWLKAFEIYEALEQSFNAKNPNATSLPIIRLRKGRAMAALGQPEAEPLIESALVAIDNRSELSDDRYKALIALADIAESRFDYAQAVNRLREAASATDLPMQKISALTRGIPIAIFVDAERALQDTDEAQKLLESAQQPNKQWQALLLEYRGRVLMNLGQLKPARAALEKSITLFGGLTTARIDMFDAIARSDAAIAAALDNDPSDSVRLLSYAGASQAAEQGFDKARDLSPPNCSTNGPKPDEVAVVEFSIKDDGSVAKVRPIYFSGELPRAVEFARVVKQWSWSVDDLKKLHPFFRAQARIELRCTGAFQRPTGTDVLSTAVGKWISEKHLEPSAVPDDKPHAIRLAALRTELQTRTQSDDKALASLPTLIALSASPVVADKERWAFAMRSYEIAKSGGAQGQVLAWFWLEAQRFRRYSNENEYRRNLLQALDDPAITGDAHSDAAIRLALFDSMPLSKRRSDGKQYIHPVADSSRLPASDPYRVGAQLRLANTEFASGNLASARDYFDQTGIDAQQCALLDAEPVLASRRSTDFPLAARLRLLGGWNMMEYDISPDGVPSGIRTIAAFPPMLFGSHSKELVEGLRYQPIYRPGSITGCSAKRLISRYKINK